MNIHTLELCNNPNRYLTYLDHCGMAQYILAHRNRATTRRGMRRGGARLLPWFHVKPRRLPAGCRHAGFRVRGTTLLVLSGLAVPSPPPAMRRAVGGTALHWVLSEGGGVSYGLLVAAEDPAVLASSLFHNCLKATYADLLGDGYELDWPFLSMVIDRGLGDPMEQANTALVAAGALTLGDAHERVALWRDEGRPLVTVASGAMEVAAVHGPLTMLAPLWWSGLGGDGRGPDGRRCALLRLNRFPNTAVQVHVSMVYHAGLRGACTLDRPAAERVLAEVLSPRQQAEVKNWRFWFEERDGPAA